MSNVSVDEMKTALQQYVTRGDFNNFVKGEAATKKDLLESGNNYQKLLKKPTCDLFTAKGSEFKCPTGQFLTSITSTPNGKFSCCKFA